MILNGISNENATKRSKSCLGMTIAYLIVMCTTIEKIIKTAYGHYNTTFFTYKFLLKCIYFL